ncbi:bifunctional apoptosis regulator-like isoform X1 [Anneissia japonica]|uniref:bifunctional apoptosis regulator-like isoform X1 n=1 Tax=Anneissia japonica TaxID=1529436 RepID=UPI0014257367|nr:bifunctional apoptosis regulator-like isoform X1 [Anneissia japonica]
MAGSYNQELYARRKGGCGPPDDFLGAGGLHHQQSVFQDLPVETTTGNESLSEQNPPDNRTTESGHSALSSSGQKSFGRSVSVRDFTCACCSDLMISPTTLNCGHSFCRLCIAQWWKTSGTCTCLLCRQEWTGFPNVNYILRSTIEKACSERYHEKAALLEIKENTDLLKEFEEFGRRQKEKRSQSNHRPQDFWCGTFLTLVLIYVVYILWNWRSSDQDLLVHKPVGKWSPVDVASWVSGLGEWAHSQYSQVFLDNAIDGKLLMTLSEEDLESKPISIENNLHRRAILQSVETLRLIGTKRPTDFWEYKALNPGLSLLLVYAMKDYPRVTLAYLYLFEYDDVFLPFLNTTCPQPQSMQSFASNTLPSVSNTQFLKFTFVAIVMPYYLTARFAWEWMAINSWTSLCVILNSLFIMVIEFKRFRRFIASRGQGFLKEFFKKYTSGLLLLAISSLIYTILLPAILCDFFFYLGLYLSPVLNFYDLYISQNPQRV